MGYWSLYYHCIWATHNRDPLLVPDLRMQVHAMIANRVRIKTGRPCYVGGVENHVHLLCSIPPGMAISGFMKDIKGSSSRFANALGSFDGLFRWQAGYAVLSFDKSRLNSLIRYVSRQEQHHASGELVDELERTEAES